MSALLAMLASAAIAQESADLAYRVAGTIAIDAQHAVALIESSAGTQQAYQLGDYIDDWEIVGINSDEVTFSSAGQLARLPLEGKLERLVAQMQDAPETVKFKAGTSPLNFDRAFEKLQKLESGTAGKGSDLSYADISKALGLTARTRIFAINREVAATPVAILQMAIAALAQGNTFKVTVKENQSEIIYLTPTEK